MLSLLFKPRLIWLLAVLGLLAGLMNWGQQPADATTVYSYSNLPLACNTTVPYASTYDQTTVGGKTYYHGLSLDFPASSGVKVVTPAAGTAFVKWDGGYGNYVDVVESSGKTHRMAHLQGTGLVPNGTKVFKGQVVGLVGSTGASTGPHLHYEQRIGGSQVAISLEGPALVWGPKYTASGDRNTTHGLRSTNCIGSTSPTTAPPPPPPAPAGNGMAVVGWSPNAMLMAESGGSVAVGWNVAVPNVGQPTLSADCNFDADGATEYIGYESNLKHFVMGNPRGDNTMAWTIILRGIYNISDFACVDWNGDGLGDIWARDGSNNAIYVGYGNGAVITQWVRLKSTLGTWATIGNMETLEACDLNGDGRQEIIAYEANRRFMLGRPVGGSTLRWDYLLNNVYNLDATACGNFNPAHAGAELIGWQMLGGKGTFVIGEFAGNFAHQRWDPISPNNVGQPHRGELDSADIDRDGVAELVSHEYRNNQHYVMVADFTGARTFRWYQYTVRPFFENMQVGRFG